MRKTKDEIINILKDRNIIVTENRIKIINCLMDDLHFHSINDISKHVDNINVKSIYNNIKVLTDAGLIDSYIFNGASKFALSDNINKKSRDIHLISKTGDVQHFTIQEKIFNSIKKEIEKDNKKVKSIKIFVDIE